ncbi:hypothetical protein PBI_STASIA_80 [Mycobacterium phage Stasia]|uniref:Uncharacterized protein n=1 Tax=Mycobacterium phage Stasia TaxID=1897548 RepID=A0A1D8EUS2_9CAUD|nr:hypothetical protein KIY68_gp13 [Mycobacterium phage Stasia]AOT24736.1 hypothetical protein PBI_STASIA_80 [Mycobacterium phage Stasia]
MIEPYKGRTIKMGDEVFAYRNLHQARWSLRATTGEHRGKVIGHADDVTLYGCSLIVSEAGRQRVIAEKRKNVHAGVHGLVCHEAIEHRGERRKVSYNPYRSGSFTVNDEPVSVATYVHLAADGKAYAHGTVA